MAELALKTRVGSNYEVGDVLCAFSRQRIRCVHAEHICHIKHAGFNKDGLRPEASVAKDFLHETSQYLTRRVSDTVVERETLAIGFKELFIGTTRVPLYLSRRLRHPRHAIFGSVGNEYWYGGRRTINHTTLDAVWNAIETKTPNRETSFTRWTMQSQAGKSNLYIAVDDMTESEAELLVASDYDKTDEELADEVAAWKSGGEVGEEPIRLITRQRNQKVDWETKLSLSADVKNQITDREMIVDIRDAVTFDRATVVEAKP